FWTTAKSKIVNEEVQIHALVDGMKVIITESSVRRDLQLAEEDDKQLDGLPTHKKKYDVSFYSKKVFANMKRISKDEAIRKEGGDSLVRATTTASSLEAEQDSGNIAKTQTQATSNEPSSQGTSLALDKEDISKQERIDEIDADEDTAMVSTHDDELQDEGIEVIGEEEVVEVVTTVKMLIDTVVDVAQVTTAIVDVLVSAAKTIVTTAPTITAESTKTSVEVTQAPKRKGVMTQETEETTTTKQLLHNNLGFRTKIRSLKNKSFAKIQELFDKAMKRINTFVDFRTELVEESTKKDDTETVQESILKRTGDDLEPERSKKQKMENDKESVELKKCLEIVPYDGDEVTIDATPLFISLQQ
nr:hypothetical protein [Tanacetum cinerariifolium]